MILVPDETCWRVTRSDRVAFLVDGAAYFAAVREAILRARHAVLLVGWDFDSQVPLVPEKTPRDGFPATLLPLLEAALRRRPRLEAHVLAWDYSFIYALEREPLPAIKFGGRGHRRLRFALDDAPPAGASHHQKIVVVDDRIAFVGGLDLTFARWDTPEHLARDPRRLDAGGGWAPPIHDVQMVVDGETARALGDLVRARWLGATGRSPRPPPEPAPTSPRSGRRRPETAPEDPWPEALVPDIVQARVGIARTAPAIDSTSSEAREILALTLRAVSAARRSLYVENQYLTSAAFGAAVARRLQARDGPEILIVVPRFESGWLERSSMGVMRDRLLARLRASDRYGRLGIYHPIVAGLGPGECLNVHSKVLIVDDTLVKVGSANLSNRSMGLDSECDVAVEADAPAVARAISSLRSRLLAEHLGVPRASLDERIAKDPSLLAAIESLRGGSRTLEPHAERPAGPPVDLGGLEELVADPERPLDPDKLVEQFVPRSLRRPARRSLALYALLLGSIVALTVLWLWAPAGRALSLDRLVELGRALRDSRFGPLAAVGVFVAGGLLFVPITPLIAASAMVFGPWRGFVVTLVGSLASASVGYGVGRWLGRPVAARLLSPRLRALRHQLRRRGFLAIVGARVLPVGSFSLVNVLAGALAVGFRPFIAGNVVGLLPGILAMTLFAGRLGKTIGHPEPGNVLALAALAVLLVAALAFARRALGRSLPRAVGRGRLATLGEVKKA